jgi:hypothetical protein
MKKTTYFLFVFIGVLSISCNAQKKIKLSCDLTKVSEAEYKAIDNIISIDTTNPQISKREEKIELLILNGNKIIFSDTLVKEEDPEMEKYDYLGFLPNINCFVIRATYLTDEELILVSKVNGAKQKLLRFVVPTNNDFILTYDIPNADHYNGIKIFKKSKNEKFLDICSVKEAEWFPEDIRVESLKSYIIKATQSDKPYGEYIYYRLLIK